jgi:hypothetical protein
VVSQARQHFLHVPVWSSMAISADPSSPSCLNDIRAVLCSPLAAINSSRAAYGRLHSSTGCQVSCSQGFSTSLQARRDFVSLREGRGTRRKVSQKRTKFCGGNTAALHGVTYPVSRDHTLWI